jgi:AraC-like DNA-binding protein
MSRPKDSVYVVKPSARLAEQVHAFVCRVVYGAPAGDDGHTVLPGSLTSCLLIVHRGTMVLPQSGLALPRASLIGVQTRPVLVRTSVAAEWTAVMFRPGAVSDLLGVPATAIRDGLYDAAAVLQRPDYADFCASLAGVPPSAIACVPAIEGFLVERLYRIDAARRKFSRLLHLALADLERMSVAALAEALRVTPKTLLRRTVELYGTSPKLLLRLARVHAALRQLHSHSDTSLAAVAQDHGFVDQAHLAREFKALLGETPSRVRRTLITRDRSNWIYPLQHADSATREAHWPSATTAYAAHDAGPATILAELHAS